MDICDDDIFGPLNYEVIITFSGRDNCECECGTY